jgi:hypothetical protein
VGDQFRQKRSRGRFGLRRVNPDPSGLAVAG